jgi:hypothetical protein
MSELTGELVEVTEPNGRSRWLSGDLWERRLGGIVVAGVAAYASYQHQWVFALNGGADEVLAAVWPLGVDGLLMLATRGLFEVWPCNQPPLEGHGVAGFPSRDRSVLSCQHRRRTYDELAADPSGRLAAGRALARSRTSEPPLRRATGRISRIP